MSISGDPEMLALQGVSDDETGEGGMVCRRLFVALVRNNNRPCGFSRLVT